VAPVTAIPEPPLDHERRAFLTWATAGLGAAGIGFGTVPFLASWLPSERARALGAPVTVDLGSIEPGQMQLVVWRRKPVYIVRRTPAMLSLLSEHNADLKDPSSQDSDQPAYADNTLRSRTPDIFVVIGVCTHLGCLPKARFQPHDASLGANWPGGFYCPCHGSRFDLSGRVFKGSPASINLVIPPYELLADNQLLIGTDRRSAA
jgi:ubiquinol-cytochrome c reductase iron-sulfur subunit